MRLVVEFYVGKLLQLNNCFVFLDLDDDDKKYAVFTHTHTHTHTHTPGRSPMVKCDYIWVKRFGVSVNLLFIFSCII